METPCAAASSIDVDANSLGLATSALALQMRLQEPQVLVGVARNAGEQVRRVGVAQLVGQPDRGAYLLAEIGQAVGQRFQMLDAFTDVERIRCQRTGAGRRLQRAARAAAKCG